MNTSAPAVVQVRPGVGTDGAPLLDDSTDDDLMRLARGGAPDAFAVLVRRHQVHVLRLAARQLGRGAAVADVAQNAFIAVYLALPRYEARGRFTAYLYRAVLNECRMARRSDRTRARVAVPLDMGGADQDRVASPAISAEATILAYERQRQVEAAVGRLSDKLRDVVSLRYAAGLSHDEIAETLKIPLGTVKRRLFDAMEKLRQHLEEP